MDVEQNTTLSNLADESGLSTLSVVRVVLILLICIFGLLANMVVIFLVLVLKEYKKTVTHWYVLQLAVADSIFLLTLPFQASEELNESWIYSVGMCKAKDAILFINYYASIMFLMIMSIDRYIAVCHHFSEILQRLRKQKSALIITGCVWVIAILISVPIMFFSTTAGIEPNCRCTTVFPSYKNYTANCLEQGTSLEECEEIDHSITCHPELEELDYSGNIEDYLNGLASGGAPVSGDGEEFTPEQDIIAPECHYFDHPYGWKVFIAFNVSVMFVLPFLVMSLCYGLIMRKLYGVKQTATTSSRKGSSRSENDRKRITIMCVILVITFVVCWAPFHAVHLSKIQGIPTNHGDSCIIASMISIMLAYVNSALNPYLYSCLGSGFKQKIKSLQAVPAMKPLMAMTSLNKTKLKTKGQMESKSGETRKSVNTKDLSSSQNPSTMVTKAVLSRASESSQH